MSIVFDITETPPELAAITTKREQAVIERAIFRKKNIRFMVGMATVTTVYVTFIVMYVLPLLERPETGIIFYFFPYLTFLIFIVGNELHIKHIEKPSKILDQTIAELSEVVSDEIHSLIENKEHSPEVASYIDRVTAQGRAFVHAEVEAIQKWYEEKSQ